MMRRVLLAVGSAMTVTFLATGVPAAAAPLFTPPVVPALGSPRIDHVDMVNPQLANMFVDSPVMGRIIEVQVLLPKDTSSPRPSLYMLDGVSAGQESQYTESTWLQKTNIAAFFADKDVNVVLPVGGTSSYYTDWQEPDPILGINMWETFLTSELPPLVNQRFDGNGINSIAGLSMGATGAMNLITRHPDLYKGVAGLSGCYDNSQPNLRDSVRATVASNGGNATNMWGENSDPAWIAHDPTVNAGALRNKTVFVSSGNGFPGPYEAGGGAAAMETITTGGPLELAALYCTTLFTSRLQFLGIPATVLFRPYGTHSWPYWQDDLPAAWSSLRRGLGL